MNEYVPQVITDIVKNGLCIGCGACVVVCPNKAIKMEWNQNGMYEPQRISNCYGEKKCIEVCPFDINDTNKLTDENYLCSEISNCGKYDLSFKDNIVGHYHALYAGYSKEYRLSSSSGGMITWLIKKLLEEDKADYVISVGNYKKTTDAFFDYMIFDKETFSTKQSGTKYYPLQFSNVLKTVIESEGRYIFVGVPCYIKAIRQLQAKNDILKRKIVYLIGLFCGGMKNKFYTEFLASNVNVVIENIKDPEFRLKQINGEARDYSFGCIDDSSKEFKSIKMKNLPDMWGTGLFKPNACDYCVDISAELADISFGDAWIPPYDKDGKGYNIVISRSKEFSQLLDSAKKNNEIYLNKLPLGKTLQSQKGNIMHRRIGLSYRLKWGKENNLILPPKRVTLNKRYNFIEKKVYYHRMIVRKKSTDIWKRIREENKLKQFNQEIKPSMNKLLFWTRINHKIRRIKKLCNIQTKEV
ncbi:4Fe-4S dicluster domain-containing protein [bacterium]|nr:MAG: 4Fe-4S dicluster domain-containing protein [bacterium]